MQRREEKNYKEKAKGSLEIFDEEKGKFLF